MLRRCKKLLAFLLALALVFTTFSSDYASAKVYAENDVEDLEDKSAEENGEEEDEDEESEDEEKSDDEAGDNDDGAGDESDADDADGDDADGADDDADDADDADGDGAEGADGEESKEDAESEEIPEEVIPEEEIPAEEEAEEESEENSIVVKYIAGKGGSVSKAEESFDPVSEEITLEGSTATPDEGYKFVNWTHGSDILTTNATYVPSVADITEDVEYKANFELVEIPEEIEEETEEVEMPEKEFKGSAGSVSVTVEAPEGAFPEGTVMEVSWVSDQDKLEAIKTAVGGSENNENQKAVAVDISFIYEDKEIEPEKEINVKITSSAIESAESATVVHLDDDNEASVVDADISGASAEFSSDEFSVYGVVIDEVVVVHTRTYVFYDLNEETQQYEKYYFENTAGESVCEQIVKAGDTLHRVETPSPENHVGRDFLGWFVGDTELTFGEVGEIDADEEIEVRARYSNYYVVTYLDDQGDFITDAVTDGSFSIGENYQVTDPQAAFLGWKPTSTENIVGTAKEYYALNDTLTIKGNVTLQAEVAEGNWIVFDNDATGATYVAPVFVPNGKKASGYVPTTAPQRTGYTFLGWFNKKGATQADTPYNFDKELSENITVYAGWKSVTEADYSIVLWKETGDGEYAFKEEIKLHGTVGDKISEAANLVIKSNTGANGCKVTIKGETYEEKGFVPSDDTYGDTYIKPEGNAVLNIKFNRIEYTFKFILADQNGRRYYKYESSTDTFSGGKALTDTSLLSGAKYEGGEYYFEIKAKYGDSIDWPEYSMFTNVENYVGLKLISWVLMDGAEARIDDSGTDGHGTVKGRINIMDTQIIGNWRNPDGNYIHGRFNTNPKTYYYHIFVEALDRDGAVQGPGNAWYVEYLNEPIMAKSTSQVTGQKAPAFVGFTFPDPKYTKGYRVDKGGPDDNHHINFYYERNKHDIIFKDGVYESSTGESYERQAGDFKTVSNVPFEKNISAEGNYEPTSPQAGFVFAGWYDDPNCTTPYTFDKMPDENVVVYAKWAKKQYRVIFHDAAPNTSVLVDLGATITAQAPVKEGSEFLGWSTASDGSRPFNIENTQMNDSTTVAYSEAEQAQYGDDKRSNVNKKLDLYAIWRDDLNGGYIRVEYANDAGVISSIVDDTHYQDSAVTIAKAYTLTPPQGKIFDHWVVQKYVNGQYVDSEVVVKSGRTFQVLKTYAKEDTATKIFTLRLKAAFIDEEKIEVTTIVFDGNGGKTTRSSVGLKIVVNDAKTTVTYNDYKINEGLEVTNEGFGRTGYEFLGWSLTRKEASASYTAADVDFQIGDIISADNIDIDETQNTIYAVWKTLNAHYVVKYYQDDLTGDPIGTSAVYEAPIGSSITLTNEATATQPSINAKRPEGYKEGKQIDAPYVIQEDTFDEAGEVVPQVIKVVYEAASITIYVSGYEKTFPYDGDKHEVKGFEVTRTNNGDVSALLGEVTYDGKDSKNANAIEATDVSESGKTDFDISKFRYSGKEYKKVTFAFETGEGYYPYNKITIEPVTVTVKPKDDDFQNIEFDGKEHVVTDIKFVGTAPAGVTPSVTEFEKATDSQTGKQYETNKRTLTGVQAVVIDKQKVVLKKGSEDITANFTINVQPGKIKIVDRTNKYVVNLSSDPVEKVYNGQIQTVMNGVAVTDPTDESAIKQALEAIANFFTLGILIVHAEEQPGIEFEREGVTYKLVNAIATASGRDVADNYEFELNEGEYQILLGDADVTGQFKVNYTPSVLKIIPAPFTITAGNKEKYVDDPTPEDFTAVPDGFVGEDLDNAEIIEEMLKAYYQFECEDGNVAGAQYPIKVSLAETEEDEELSAILANYEIEFIDGSLNVLGRTTPPTPTPTPPTPTPTPTPTPDDTPDDTPDTPSTTTTTIPDAPVALTPTPAGAVLGAQREVPVDGPAVLGARRAGTDDSTNRTARAFIILVSAAVALSLVIIGKKKRENEED